ncbi:MAG: hypothetical protein ACK4XJ_01400 [Fimbriimonadaceae bacterium]
MPTVVLTVDCEAAHHDRCYTGAYIDILESEFVPATWLIHVSMKDPTANTNLYYHEFIHKIPNWHEIGMKVNFENERGYVEDEKERGNIIRVAKDALKSHLIKCTSFRAGCYALMPSDVKYLEDIGILVDTSVIPDAEYRMFVDWTGAPRDPYHSAHDDLKNEGSNRILHVPVATHEGKHGYLDLPWSELQALVDANLDREVICLGMRDYSDSSENLKRLLGHLRSKDAHFTTLTQAASEHYEMHPAMATA